MLSGTRNSPFPSPVSYCFFVGAPLGAIIRKGGLGFPVVISTFFFVLYHILSMTGEKYAKAGTLPIYQGMWIASLVFLPIGIFLTIKATSDSPLFDMEAYTKFFQRIFNRKSPHKE
jgi:lipopolysaccharide export system permease protein